MPCTCELPKRWPKAIYLGSDSRREFPSNAMVFLELLGGRRGGSGSSVIMRCLRDRPQLPVTHYIKVMREGAF